MPELSKATFTRKTSRRKTWKTLLETSWNTLKAMCGIMTSFKLTSQSEACLPPPQATSMNSKLPANVAAAANPAAVQ